jgi:DnaK suppressor protein
MALARVRDKETPAMHRTASRPHITSRSIRGLLLARRSELLGHLGEVRLDTQTEREPVGEEDLAQLSHEEFISVSRNQMDYQALRQVERALERLETGEFGSCEACGEPIGEKRLRAVPWACLCVRCQEEAQRAEREDAAVLQGAFPHH